MTDLTPGTMLTLDGEQYMIQDAGSPWSLEMPDASTLRFEVQQGDYFSADPTTKNRSEVAMQGTITDGTEINVSYGMDVEPGAANTSAFCMLGQFHQAQGTAVSSLGPPFSIQLVGERMSVVVGYTDSSGNNVTKTIFVDSADIVRGHNYAMNIQVVFGPNGNGSLVVSRDGLTLVSYTGPLGYQGEGGVYWKEGIYRAAAPETLAVDYSNLAVATSTPTSTPAGPGVQSYTQYDSAGNPATSFTLYVDGSTTTSKYSSGTLTQTCTVHADGSRDVYDYGVTGQNYVSDHRVYNAAGTLTQFTANAADGSMTVTDYVVGGQAYGSDQLSYNANGVLITAVYNNTDGSTTTDRYDGTGALVQYTVAHADGSRDVYDYNVTGQNYVSDHRIYSPAGTLTQFVGTAADGSKIVYDYAVANQSYTSDQLSYNAAGVLTSAIYFNSDGSTVTDKFSSGGILSQMTIMHADGSRDVYDYGVTGQNYVSDHRVYNAAGTLTQFVGTAADGSKTVYDYAVTGQSYTSDQLSYNTVGALTLAVYFNSDGSTTTEKFNSSGAVGQMTIAHADGSRDVYDYGVTGQNYVSDHRVYNAAGTMTQFTGFAADGSKIVYDYAVTGQSYTSDQLSYNTAGGLTSAVYFNIDGSTTTEKLNSSGAISQTTIVHTDGSHDVYDYGVTGQSYVSDHRVYNAAGTLSEFVGINADGSKMVNDFAVTGQSYTSDQLSYNAAGAVTTAVYFNKDGSTTTDKFNSNGTLSQITTIHADGSHDVYDYGLTGQYVSDHRVYNTAGTLTEYVGLASDGSKIVCDYAVTGTSYGSDQLNYSSSGVLVNALYRNNDGSTTTDKYNSAGSLTQVYTTYPNGAHEVYDYGITGQSYVADHRVYNTAGTLTEFVTIASDGTEKVNAYASGLQLSGGAGSDSFNSYGGDSFVFKGSFGNDVVNYFHAGDVANHDTLVFAASAVPDYAHLQMAQSGNNVVITIDAHDTVTLTGIKLAALTANDFVFA